MDYSDRLIDFMYVDKNKASMLLSQILSEGLVTEIESITERSKEGEIAIGATTGKIAAILGVDVGADGKRISREATQETIRRNPEWAQAKALVQYIADHQDQHHDDTDKIESLRIISGSLEIFDLSPFRKAADNSELVRAAQKLVLRHISTIVPALKEIESRIEDLEKAIPKNSQLKKPKAELEKARKEYESAKDPMEDYVNAAVAALCHFVNTTPFSIIATLRTDSDSYWFSMKEGSLLHDQGDTLLKYGYRLEGSWSIGGIVDGSSPIAQSLMTNAAPWEAVAAPIADAIRVFVGRPENRASILPIVIYRDLGKLLK